MKNERQKVVAQTSSFFLLFVETFFVSKAVGKVCQHSRRTRQNFSGL
jgi:hypothetical protein